MPERDAKDDDFVDMLAKFDEALRHGQPPLVTGAHLQHDSSSRLKRAQRCILLLEAAKQFGASLEPWNVDAFERLGNNPEDDILVAQLPKSIGRFAIVDILGSGSCGVVYLAHDPNLDRLVALKVPHAAVLLSADMRRRVLREATRAAALSHPNIATVYDAGALSQTCWIAMEYCSGQTLADLIAASPEGLPAEVAANLVEQMAAGIAHAHTRNVLHRDIKPANIILTSVGHGDVAAEALTNKGFDAACIGVPKVIDFGLGRDLLDESCLTHNGTLIGTLAYSAPEQAAGRIDHVGQRSDIYALGVVLFELLTGQRPFRGDSTSVRHQILHDNPPNAHKVNERVPANLAAICLKCMAKHPLDRYDSAEALAIDLMRWRTAQSVHACPGRRTNPVSHERLDKRFARGLGKMSLLIFGTITTLSLLGILPKLIGNDQRTKANMFGNRLEAYLERAKYEPSEQAPGGLYSLAQRWYLDPIHAEDEKHQAVLIRSHQEEKNGRVMVLSYVDHGNNQVKVDVEDKTRPFGDSSQRWHLEPVSGRRNVYVIRNRRLRELGDRQGRKDLVLCPVDSKSKGVVLMMEPYVPDNEAQMWEVFNAPTQSDKWVFRNVAREREMNARSIPTQARDVILDYRAVQ